MKTWKTFLENSKKKILLENEFHKIETEIDSIAKSYQDLAKSVEKDVVDKKYFSISLNELTETFRLSKDELDYVMQKMHDYNNKFFITDILYHPATPLPAREYYFFLCFLKDMMDVTNTIYENSKRAMQDRSKLLEHTIVIEDVDEEGNIIPSQPKHHTKTIHKDFNEFFKTLQHISQKNYYKLCDTDLIQTFKDFLHDVQKAYKGELTTNQFVVKYPEINRRFEAWISLKDNILRKLKAYPNEYIQNLYDVFIIIYEILDTIRKKMENKNSPLLAGVKLFQGEIKTPAVHIKGIINAKSIKILNLLYFSILASTQKTKNEESNIVLYRTIYNLKKEEIYKKVQHFILDRLNKFIGEIATKVNNLTRIEVFKEIGYTKFLDNFVKKLKQLSDEEIEDMAQIVHKTQTQEELPIYSVLSFIITTITNEIKDELKKELDFYITADSFKDFTQHIQASHHSLDALPVLFFKNTSYDTKEHIVVKALEFVKEQYSNLPVNDLTNQFLKALTPIQRVIDYIQGLRTRDTHNIKLEKYTQIILRYLLDRNNDKINIIGEQFATALTIALMEDKSIAKAFGFKQTQTTPTNTQNFVNTQKNNLIKQLYAFGQELNAKTNTIIIFNLQRDTYFTYNCLGILFKVENADLKHNLIRGLFSSLVGHKTIQNYLSSVTKDFLKEKRLLVTTPKLDDQLPTSYTPDIAEKALTLSTAQKAFPELFGIIGQNFRTITTFPHNLELNNTEKNVYAQLYKPCYEIKGNNVQINLMFTTPIKKAGKIQFDEKPEFKFYLNSNLGARIFDFAKWNYSDVLKFKETIPTHQNITTEVVERLRTSKNQKEAIESVAAALQEFSMSANPKTSTVAKLYKEVLDEIKTLNIPEILSIFMTLGSGELLKDRTLPETLLVPMKSGDKKDVIYKISKKLYYDKRPLKALYPFLKVALDDVDNWRGEWVNRHLIEQLLNKDLLNDKYKAFFTYHKQLLDLAQNIVYKKLNTIKHTANNAEEFIKVKDDIVKQIYELNKHMSDFCQKNVVKPVILYYNKFVSQDSYNHYFKPLDDVFEKLKDIVNESTEMIIQVTSTLDRIKELVPQVINIAQAQELVKTIKQINLNVNILKNNHDKIRNYNNQIVSIYKNIIQNAADIKLNKTIRSDIKNYARAILKYAVGKTDKDDVHKLLNISTKKEVGEQVKNALTKILQNINILTESEEVDIPIVLLPTTLADKTKHKTIVTLLHKSVKNKQPDVIIDFISRQDPSLEIQLTNHVFFCGFAMYYPKFMTTVKHILQEDETYFSMFQNLLDLDQKVIRDILKQEFPDKKNYSVLVNKVSQTLKQYFIEFLKIYYYLIENIITKMSVNTYHPLTQKFIARYGVDLMPAVLAYSNTPHGSKNILSLISEVVKEFVQFKNVENPTVFIIASLFRLVNNTKFAEPYKTTQDINPTLKEPEQDFLSSVDDNTTLDKTPQKTSDTKAFAHSTFVPAIHRYDTQLFQKSIETLQKIVAECVLDRFSSDFYRRMFIKHMINLINKHLPEQFMKDKAKHKHISIGDVNINIENIINFFINNPDAFRELLYFNVDYRKYADKNPTIKKILNNLETFNLLLSKQRYHTNIHEQFKGMFFADQKKLVKHWTNYVSQIVKRDIESKQEQIKTCIAHKIGEQIGETDKERLRQLSNMYLRAFIRNLKKVV